MKESEITNYYNKKIKELKKHNKLYFEKSSPKITDYQYDLIKKEIIEKGVSIIKHGDSKFKKKQYEYPITHQLIKDGRKNKVFTKKIKIKIKVTMFHGQMMRLFQFLFLERFYQFFQKQKKNCL